MRRFWAVMVLLALAMPALGVTTSHWTQENAADFKAGTSHNVVVTNLGDVKLSRAIQSIKEQDANVTTVNALAQTADGVIYAGTGPKGILLSLKDGKVATVATIADAVNILSLCADDQGALYIGTGGAKGKIYKIGKAGDAPQEIFSAPDVQYVWGIQRTADGNLYAATGPNGQVFEITPDGNHSVLYKSAEDNITALLSDGQDLLYLGTDPNGLVIRLNRKTKDAFILYNATETDVTALAMDEAGNLYAATGEAGNREQPAADQSAKDKTGRPESKGSSPIPSNPPPAPPKPPGQPAPAPNQPQAIPHAQIVDPARPLMLDGGDNGGGAAGGGDNGGGGGGDNGNDNGDNGNNDAVAPGQAAHPPTPQQNPPAQGPEGNAIYKIDKDGFVTEIFRQNAVIYSMIAAHDVLIVGTGDEGNIYQVNPAAEETVVLAKLDAKQVMCLLPVKDGRIILGVANTGGISAMTGGYATSGTYTSAVLDAAQVSRFGNLQLHGQLPEGTELKVSTRSGNIKDATAPGWSKWTEDVGASEFVPVGAPSARFLQYRLTFGSANAANSPVVDHVDIAYQIPNLAPVVKSIKIAGAEGAATGATQGQNGAHTDNAAKSVGGTGTQTITWDASDVNGDTLIYSLYFRQELNGPWILLKEKLKESTFEWDTRMVADGRYQVKVVASDAPSNPPGQAKTASRVSDYVVVDNTPPSIGDVDVKLSGGDVTVTVRAQDLISIVSAVDYTVDSSDDWQTALPASNIFDSQDVTVTFTAKGLTVGDHQVTIRAVDSHGNQSLRTVGVTITAPKS